MPGLQEWYLKVRSKENRVYSDAQVKMLPDIEKSHQHYTEWQIRKKSAQQLVKYIESVKKPLKILEIGCGNGWLSAKMADIANTQVTGWDVNEPELEQAKRVFAKKQNLAFYLTSIMDLGDPKEKFDLIIFAASVQYFPSFKALINKVMKLLNQDGEIHILDSIFYNSDEITAAKKRSKQYFDSMEVSEMAGHYFHHALDVLKEFNHRKIYDPASIWNTLFNRKNPFYWIVITR